MCRTEKHKTQRKLTSFLDEQRRRIRRKRVYRLISVCLYTMVIRIKTSFFLFFNHKNLLTRKCPTTASFPTVSITFNTPSSSAYKVLGFLYLLHLSFWPGSLSALDLIERVVDDAVFWTATETQNLRLFHSQSLDSCQSQRVQLPQSTLGLTARLIWTRESQIQDVDHYETS